MSEYRQLPFTCLEWSGTNANAVNYKTQCHTVAPAMFITWDSLAAQQPHRCIWREYSLANFWLQLLSKTPEQLCLKQLAFKQIVWLYLMQPVVKRLASGKAIVVSRDSHVGGNFNFPDLLIEQWGHWGCFISGNHVISVLNVAVAIWLAVIYKNT